MNDLIVTFVLFFASLALLQVWVRLGNWNRFPDLVLTRKGLDASGGLLLVLAGCMAAAVLFSGG